MSYMGHGTLPFPTTGHSTTTYFSNFSFFVFTFRLFEGIFNVCGNQRFLFFSVLIDNLFSALWTRFNFNKTKNPFISYLA